MPNSAFHLAIPVHNLEQSRKFYSQILGFEEGRSSDKWVDFNCYGHQLVIHEVKEYSPQNHFNPVDNHHVPVPHFGVVLLWKAFWDLSQRLKALKIKFQIEPYIRFEGQTGEQATMFFYDPSGNALEFKAFQNPDQLFKS
ncbi:VOC family protein [Flavobacterium sp. CS20]|jgi:extradiol dioxygenase family protein|uniref:VOC family protein n=1 Tax=Flavobacterium sp. CS20 TaxID=2775246 RepID=UPI001B3A4695|nr:VOC family protein [Flavobacterium sp. CS20]QTY27427.1 VOC family protein [Flavobacterium sp. CS20]